MTAYRTAILVVVGELMEGNMKKLKKWIAIFSTILAISPLPVQQAAAAEKTDTEKAIEQLQMEEGPDFIHTEKLDMANMKFVEEYTENGAHVMVYEIISDIPEIMPRFPVYKKIGIWVSFNGGNYIPPSTYSYKIENDPDYNTYMSGTLYLKKTETVIETGQKKTNAYYEGTISGNI